MNKILTQKIYNGSIDIYFNTETNQIKEIKVYHKDSLSSYILILTLNHDFNSQKRVLADYNANLNDILSYYDYVNLKQEALALFLTENLTLEVLNNLGYK